jgi:hypothetical protein
MEDRDPSSSIVDAAGNHAVSCAAFCPTSTAAGRHGNGFRFSGQQYLQIAAPDLQSIRRAYTIAIWAYPEALPSEESCAFTKPSGLPNYDGNSFSLCFDKGGKPYEYTTKASAPQEQTLYGPPLPVMQWHHLAASWDGVAKKLYVDGTAQGQVVFEIYFDDGIPVVGADANVDATNPRAFWTGILDDAVLYDRVLTQEELCALADQPPGC